MANEKKLNTRILLRYDDYSNWYNKNPKLLKGEVAIATIPENHVDPSTGEVTQIPAVVMKVGTGAETGSNYRDLPFTSAKAADVYAWAKAETLAVSGANGEGNAFTNVEWDATLNGGKGGLKFTKGTKFATSAELEAAVEKFTGDVGSITDTDTKTTVELVTAEGDAHKGQIKVSIQKTVDGANDGDPIVTYLDVVTPDELGNTLLGYVDFDALGFTPTSEYPSFAAYMAAQDADVLSDAKAYVDEEDVFETDMTTINALGGIAAGADLNGLTTHEVLKKLLYPYVDATVGNATATPNGGTYEKGATKTITQVSISITKKSEPITSVALYNGSTLIEEKTGDAVKNGGTITFSGLSVVVPTNGNQLTVKVTYPGANGNAKTVEKKTTALSFVYPYYMGTCAAGTAVDETLVESLTKKIEGKGNKSNSFTVSDGHMVFAYPKAHGVLKSILDPNNFETIGNYTRSEVSVTGLDGTAQTYYVYVSGATTVSGFVVNFKY